MKYSGKYSIKRYLLKENLQNRVITGAIAENLARIHYGMPITTTHAPAGEADLVTPQGTFECKSAGKSGAFAAEITASAPSGRQMKVLARQLGGKSAGAKEAVNNGWSKMQPTMLDKKTKKTVPDPTWQGPYTSADDYKAKVADWYVNTKSEDGVILVTGCVDVMNTFSSTGLNWKTASQQDYMAAAKTAGCIVKQGKFDDGIAILGVSSYGEATAGTRIKIIVKPASLTVLKSY